MSFDRLKRAIKKDAVRHSEDLTKKREVYAAQFGALNAVKERVSTLSDIGLASYTTLGNETRLTLGRRVLVMETHIRPEAEAMVCFRRGDLQSTVLYDMPSNTWRVDGAVDGAVDGVPYDLDLVLETAMLLALEDCHAV